MNIEQFRTYCMAKKAVTEHFPFDNDVLVFQGIGKNVHFSVVKQMGARRRVYQFKMRSRLCGRTESVLREHQARLPHAQTTMEQRLCS